MRLKFKPTITFSATNEQKKYDLMPSHVHLAKSFFNESQKKIIAL